MQPHQAAACLRPCRASLEIVEGGADMARRVLATDLDADIGRVIVQVRDENSPAPADRTGDSSLDHGFHAACETAPRSHRRGKTPRKVPTSAPAISPAQHLGRLVDRAHRLDDPEHGGDDAERRQRVGHRLQGVGRVPGVLGVGFRGACREPLPPGADRCSSSRRSGACRRSVRPLRGPRGSADSVRRSRSPPDPRCVPPSATAFCRPRRISSNRRHRRSR